jgi:uncharacterized protein (TIGR03067 family)
MPSSTCDWWTTRKLWHPGSENRIPLDRRDQPGVIWGWSGSLYPEGTVWRRTPILLAAVLAVASHGQDAATGKDLKALQDVWQALSMKVGGKRLPAEDAGTWSLAVTGRKAVIRENSNLVIDGTITVDAARRPQALDFLVADVMVEAIYRLETDTLTVCVDLPPKLLGARRPKEFASKEGTYAVLVVFKRPKK